MPLASYCLFEQLSAQPRNVRIFKVGHDAQAFVQLGIEFATKVFASDAHFGVRSCFCGIALGVRAMGRKDRRAKKEEEKRARRKGSCGCPSGGQEVTVLSDYAGVGLALAARQLLEFKLPQIGDAGSFPFRNRGRTDANRFGNLRLGAVKLD